MTRAIELLLLFFLSGSSVCGAEENIVKETLNRTGDVLSSPARLDRASALWLGGIAAGGLLVYSEDGQIRRVFKKNRSAANDNTSKVLEKFGDGGYEMAFLGVYGGLGYAFKKPAMRRTAALSLEAFAAANAVGTIFKYAAGRYRPYSNNGKRSFRPFKVKTANTSFPSGHTTSVFALAAVFAGTCEKPAVGIAAYYMAAGTALQRVYADKHWASDVFAGAALGTAVGRWLVKRERAGSRTSAMVLPVYSPDYSGAAAVFSF
ncbi:MAG: phosphatase PAP2 family protein [Elusimicrobiota bacterium]